MKNANNGTKPAHETVSAARSARIAVVALAAALAVVTPRSAPAADAAQKHFASPEEATQAMATALRAKDKAALLAIFGPDATELIESGDSVADATAGARFLEMYDEAHALDTSAEDTAILQVGKTEWPFPIPLVKTKEGWRFDTAAGEEEILDRRVGRNELATIKVCLAYADAQHEYYERNPDKDSLQHYAKQFMSSAGKHDGLYWETAAGDAPSPLGPLMAQARSEGYAGEEKAGAYHGYRFKILTAQGPDAPGGAYDYIVKGDKMIGGFGMVAYPAQYGNSGVMSFIINHDGVVYEKDLGEKTSDEIKKMTTFNPDKSWKRVEAD